jgi:hypothetical protein
LDGTLQWYPMDGLTILFSLLSGGGAAVAVVFLAKTTIQERLKNAIKHEYDVKFEAYKTQVKAEADATLERLRADLQIAATEHQIRYSRIFATQAEVISQTYGKLITLRDAVGRYVHPVTAENMPSLEERRKVVGSAYADFREYFEPRRLFFPAPIASQIQEFSGKLHKTAFEFLYTVETDIGRHKNKLDHWLQAWDFVEKETPKLMEKLEGEFRDRLGITKLGQVEQSKKL